MRSILELSINDEFNPCRTWINNARSHEKTWEEILFGCKNDEQGLEKFIETRCDDDFWTITTDEWKLLVEEMRKVEESSSGGFIGDPVKPWISVPDSKGSCWHNYKKKLESQNFTYLSISNIEKSSQKIISYLNDNTEQIDPVRGMVVGNVQSGKTANMAGVIAMAADYGYNFFIVLTGTIDNLRIQTRKRLLSDLNYPSCNLFFETLDGLSSKSIYPHRLQDLTLSSNRRYISVCLKNSTRLKELLNWINKDQKAKSNLKVLVIDDEADQAGVNTKDIDTTEQTTISRLIKNLVFGRNAKDEKRGNYRCMNYIGYTATPYANFLNESGADTLYPKNFISLLSPSPEYFGPQQIFGISGINDPLNIVNFIDDEDIDAINNDEEVLGGKLPSSLRKAILWFAITVACFRYFKLEKPASMLIHTSQKVERHDALSKAISSFLNKNTYKSLEKELIEVYNEQTALLPLSNFKDLMDEYNDIDNVRDYPDYESLVDYLKELLDEDVTHIQLDDDGDRLLYSKGLHLCVDNCSRKKIEDDSIEMRIVYPEDDNPILKESPAFIVIGGTTLSRGLTLQGLTTSFFLRSTSQADTLMQMGRWFGYRKGYELLQRLWLSNETISRFNRLTRLDYDLRQELCSMELKGLSPKNYGPKLDSFPDYKLLVITSKNKKQSTVECQTTFYNKTAQTTWFRKDDINENYDNTISFLNSLGDIDKQKIQNLKNPYANDKSIMWFDVDYEKVIDYLKILKIPHQSASFDDYDSLKEWYKNEFEKGTMGNWTVIAGSVKDKINNDVVLDNGITIHLENRTRIERKGLVAKDPNYYDNIIDLNTIHQPADRLMDIDCSKLSKFDYSELIGNKKKFIEKRIKYASKINPLLVVYIVDKDSEVEAAMPVSALYNRYSLKSLNLDKHIVGYYLYIPYGKGENEGYVTINLKYDSNEKDGETNDA